MELAGKVVVVTGAGSGIGRALAKAFAAAGAAVVAGDLDAPAAEHTAARIRGDGARAVGTGADASTTEGIATLLDTAREHFGPVDVYVANAGIMGQPGLGADEQAWDRIIDVNLRAHVRAAKALVPEWLDRGAGHFVAVASAAGLLTQLGAAGYSVTKHAAVGFAEWLSITYGDNGIGVSCVCPMGVDTAVPIEETVGAMAELVVEAVRANAFLVLPHPVVLDMYRQKGADYERWLAGMRRFQRGVS